MNAYQDGRKRPELFNDSGGPLYRFKGDRHLREFPFALTHRNYAHRDALGEWKSVANAAVKATPINGSAAATYSKDDGSFAAFRLEPGSWKVMAEKGTLVSATEEIELTTGHQHVNLRLSPTVYGDVGSWYLEDNKGAANESEDDVKKPELERPWRGTPGGLCPRGTPRPPGLHFQCRPRATGGWFRHPGGTERASLPTVIPGSRETMPDVSTDPSEPPQVVATPVLRPAGPAIHGVTPTERLSGIGLGCSRPTNDPGHVLTGPVVRREERLRGHFHRR